MLNLLALAFRAGYFPFVVLCQSHDHAERLVAFLAKIFILGHRRCPPRLLNVILAENTMHKKGRLTPRREDAKKRQAGSLFFFAPLAYFAALRESVFAVLRSAHSLESIPVRKGARDADLNAV